MLQGRANELPDFKVFSTVFFYCVTIIALPVLTFFGSKAILFDGILKLDMISSNVYSAISAIVALHIALAMFIIRAYSETDKEKPSKRD
ncbi:vacuolar ATPase assembly integral membrane protein VMA21 homolog [Arctopsyche grandis]|uniref:vacuolar ATPase assembly integral membrane protein VMA21 homolog n=1 Tax=Arctopsyche grandis TaxID=121162 RepID=UPI00406D7FD4